MLSRTPIEVLGVVIDGDDPEGRVISARVNGVRCVSVYLPSGSSGEHRQQAAFMHRLNWLLFRGSPVAGRWRIMSGFYTHPEETLRRFYSLALRAADRSRILRTGAGVFLASWLRGG